MPRPFSPRFTTDVVGRRMRPRRTTDCMNWAAYKHVPLSPLANQRNARHRAPTSMIVAFKHHRISIIIAFLNFCRGEACLAHFRPDTPPAHDGRRMRRAVQNVLPFQMRFHPRRSVYRRILAVVFPSQRVHLDIFSNAHQGFVIPYDVFVVITLPQFALSEKPL